MAALGSDWRIDEIFAVKPPYQWRGESSQLAADCRMMCDAMTVDRTCH